MKTGFRPWLESRYTSAAVATRLSRARLLEAAYGDLDELFEKDGFVSLLADLRYSTLDAGNGRPNPSKVKIGGDLHSGLAGLKNAVSTYRQFLETGEQLSAAVPAPSSAEAGEMADPPGVFGLERDLQARLRAHIEQLEPGLRLIDGGVERSVSSGFIDITAEDGSGAIVVIELKAGRASRDAIGQILSYMGDIADEEPALTVRGILVAAEFDHKARAAARIVAGLSLRQYRVSFAFSDAAVA